MRRWVAHHLWNLGPGYHAGRRGIAYLQPPVSDRGRCQGLRVAPIVLASMEEVEQVPRRSLKLRLPR